MLLASVHGALHAYSQSLSAAIVQALPPSFLEGSMDARAAACTCRGRLKARAAACMFVAQERRALTSRSDSTGPQQTPAPSFYKVFGCNKVFSPQRIGSPCPIARAQPIHHTQTMIQDPVLTATPWHCCCRLLVIISA